SPHAPYSVRASLFRATANLARQRGLPVAVHAAESPDELLLLAGRGGAAWPSRPGAAVGGPVVDFLSELGVWDPGGLIEHHEQLLEIFRGLPHVLFIHANYLILSAVPASVRAALRVVCPRTRAAFGFVGGPVGELGQPDVHIALG